MARFVTLASSSSGNCVYVGTSGEGILIDAGISNKQICERLNALEIPEDSIKAVFVTHEHDDHVKGLRVFCEKHNVPVYATGGTLSALTACDKLSDKITTIKMPSSPVEIGEMTIHYFRTSHDAKQSCGYVVTLPDRKIGIATDTGVMLPGILEELSDCDLCLIESNYDYDMLINGPYSPDLKNRIRSDIGHLQNTDCADTVLSLIKGGKCRRIILGHLSPHNNTPERAFSCTNSLLKHQGFIERTDYVLYVAPPDAMNKVIRF